MIDFDLIQLNHTFLLRQFLTRPVSERLGCGPDGEGNIKGHAFFSCIDWIALEAKEITPPFKPKLHSSKDVSNFDATFTSEGIAALCLSFLPPEEEGWFCFFPHSLCGV